MVARKPQVAATSTGNAVSPNMGGTGKEGRSPDAARPLDLIGETRKTPVGDTSDRVSQKRKKTAKVSEFKEFTPEEKRAWKAKRQAENRRRAEISRRWIRESGLAEKTLMTCGAKAIPTKTAEFQHKEDGAHEAGIMRCHSKWACPECSPYELWKASTKIKDLLLTLANSSTKYTVVLLTLTAPHRPGDDLRTQMRDFSRAYSHMFNSGSVRKLKKKYGYVGNIRCYDHTVHQRGGLADWHTHLHNLVVFEGDYPEGSADWAIITGTLCDQWEVSFEKKFTVKHRKVSHSALDCEYVDLTKSDELADYVAKTVSTYITKTAKNEKGVFAPFDLLNENPETLEFCRSCWLDYIDAVKGFKRVNWSCGLAAAVGLYAGTSDDEDEERKTSELLWSYIPSEEVLEKTARVADFKSLILNACDCGDAEMLVRLLMAFNAPVGVRDSIEFYDGECGHGIRRLPLAAV